MLHVIFTILKILGIIIAIILGILLLILLLVLFVPLRYKVKAKKYEKIKGIIRLSWLLHIVSAYITYANGEFIYKIKIFGFTVMNSLKEDATKDAGEIDEDNDKNIKEKHRKPKRNKNLKIDKNLKKDNKINTEKALESNNGYIHITDDYIYPINDDKDNDDKDNDVVVQAQSIEDSDKTNDSSRNTNQKVRQHHNVFITIFNKIKSILNKIKSIFLWIRDTIINIYHKIINLKDSISDKIKYFNETINTEENRKLCKFLLSQVKIILKHIAPRKYKIYIKYGADEPDVTGKVISYVAIANAFFNMNMNFVPVFDEQVLEGEIYLRGRIRVFTMLIIAFRVYRNKQFKKMIKKFK